MKDIVTLRNHLFDTLNRLAEASPEELDNEINKAASIVQVSEAIIKSAEVENQFVAITKSFGSGFVPITTPGKKGILEIISEDLKNKDEGIFDVDKEKDWIAPADTHNKKKDQ